MTSSACPPTWRTQNEQRRRQVAAHFSNAGAQTFAALDADTPFPEREEKEETQAVTRVPEAL
jgi:hypothetical protein